MTAEMFRESLTAKGFSESGVFPGLFLKPSIGCGGDIGYQLATNGEIDMVQADGTGGYILIRSAHLSAFEDTLSDRGRWQLKPGQTWRETGKRVLL
jgi:hypothetical protein